MRTFWGYMDQSKQLLREVRWALWLTLCYLVGWVGFAYFSPTGRGIFGFPIWFECACIYLPILFIFLVIIVLKLVYKEIKLEE